MNTQPDVVYSLADHIGSYPHVEKVILYGSRARGDEEERSDIDLAVTGPVTEEEWRRMSDYIELEARTLLSVELVRLEKASEKLRENIRREGVTLYERH